MPYHRSVLPALVSIVLAGFVAPPPAAAQNELPDNAAELITDYLEQDIFLRPGVGLKKVRLGMSFEALRQTWGLPSRDSGGGLMDSKWVYEVGKHTRITVSGGQSVESIRIRGGISSPYVTTEGAAFGMPRHQLATIYGAAKRSSGALSYPHRGIGFDFEQGQVSEMRVFAPD